MQSPRLKDKNIIKQSFLVSKEDLDEVDKKNRYFSSVSIKFTDSTPGGNLAINPPPQFTRYCDLKSPNQPRKVGGRTGVGMGRYHSEALDDPAQHIYVRLGVPQFNSLGGFFTGFYDLDAARLARTGRVGGVFYNLGKAAVFVVSVFNWKLLAVHYLFTGLKNLLWDKPRSKYYYLKPTMPTYWGAVQSIVSQIAINKGIVPRTGGSSGGGSESKQGDNYTFTDAEKQKISSLIPEMFSQKYPGSIDVYAIATRAQRMARLQEKRWKEANSSDRATDIKQIVTTVYGSPIQNSERDLRTYMDRWIASAQGIANSATETTLSSVQGELGDTPATAGKGVVSGSFSESIIYPNGNTDAKLSPEVGQDHWLGKWGEFLEAEFDDGGAFACFRVNATTGISESFSNSVTESEIASKINGTSSQSRSTSFSFAGGNLGEGVIASTIESIVGAAKDFAVGALDGLQIAGILTLAGGAFVDIPKHWESSSASLPRMNYTIDLVSPYNNPISQLLNIDLPLSMLLAMALPLSTGRQSYTSPFILELYDKGRAQTRLGMVDSMTITRGTSNTAFTADGVAMGVQVSFSIVDMSSVMHMPISGGFNFTSAVRDGVATAVSGALGDSVLGLVVGGTIGQVTASDSDTVFTDYINVLSSVGLADQIYWLPKLKRNLTRAAVNYDRWFSVPHYASMIGDSPIGKGLSLLYRGTVRE